jgi:hypothetical protein
MKHHISDLLEETEKYLQGSLVSKQVRVVPVSYLERVRDALKTEQMPYEKIFIAKQSILSKLFPLQI